MSSGYILQCHQVIYYNVIRWYTTMSSGYILQCHQVIYYNVIRLYNTMSSAYILQYYTLRFYFPYLSLFAMPLNIFVHWPVNILVYGPGPINIMFSSGFFSELVFCLRYTITKKCRLTDLHVLSIMYQIVHGTSDQMAAYGPACHPQNSIWTSASLRSI